MYITQVTHHMDPLKKNQTVLNISRGFQLAIRCFCKYFFPVYPGNFQNLKEMLLLLSLYSRSVQYQKPKLKLNQEWETIRLFPTLNLKVQVSPPYVSIAWVVLKPFVLLVKWCSSIFNLQCLSFVEDLEKEREGGRERRITTIKQQQQHTHMWAVIICQTLC